MKTENFKPKHRSPDFCYDELLLKSRGSEDRKVCILKLKGRR
jgi:hypothetical protein